MPIGHDGILSRILQHSTAWFGYSIWVYRRQSTVRPKDQIVDFLRSGPHVVGLFADSGGPDGIVRPGLPEVARRSEAMLIPFAISARPAVMLALPKKFTFPLPSSSIEVYWGEPIDGNNASVENCQKAIDIQVERASRGKNSLFTSILPMHQLTFHWRGQQLTRTSISGKALLNTVL